MNERKILQDVPREDVETVSVQEILKAFECVKTACTKTEIRKLDWLNRIRGINAVGKFENQQRTGSFKFRGAYNRLKHQDSTRSIIAASAGNHGLAVADAASLLGIPATVCIPNTASPVKRNRLAAYGHSIIQQGASLEEATEYAKSLAVKCSWDFVSPYNDPHIINGQGTVALEYLEQMADIDSLIVPVGGGGLISGMGIAAKYLKPSIRIIGVEPEKYASLSASLNVGQIQRVVNAPTFADGLAVNLEDQSLTFDIARQVVDEMVLVTEEEIAAATLALLYHESQLVEPSGAVGLAALMSGKIDLAKAGKIGLIFSGGNVTTANLSKIMNYPFTDEKLFDFINIHGTRVAHQAQFRGVDFSRLGETKTDTIVSDDQSAEAKADNEYWSGRFEDVRRIIENIRRRLYEYVEYCRTENIRPDASAVQLVEDFNEKSSVMLDENHVALDPNCPPSQYNLKITENLQRYRALLHMALSASMALDWRSASYGQSWDTMFFALNSQGNPGVNYNRYESNQLAFIEKMMAEVLGLDQRKTALLMTSSGMAAYNLIENYLMRYALRHGDTVLIPHYIYFETDEQISKLPGIDIERAETHNAEEIVRLIREKKPKVVFLDPLTNTVELRITDVQGVIEKISEIELEDDIYFVIDGTMMSGEFNPFTASRDNPRVKVLYYDSCSKYTQLGLDIAMGGLVAPPVELASIFDRLRRNTGTIMYDSAANIFPAYSRETHQKRMKRFTRNAVLIGNRIAEDEEVSREVKVHFPLLENHPDHELAGRFNSIGGLMTFTFQNPYLNQRDALNSFIEIALAVAKEYGVSLTKGVSFGFSIPRISAAAAMAENAPPFLRLSTGDRSYEETQLLTTALIEAFRRYVSSYERISK